MRPRNRYIAFAVISFLLLFTLQVTGLDSQPQVIEQDGRYYDSETYELVGWELNEYEIQYMVYRLRQKLESVGD